VSTFPYWRLARSLQATGEFYISGERLGSVFSSNRRFSQICADFIQVFLRCVGVCTKTRLKEVRIVDPLAHIRARQPAAIVLSMVFGVRVRVSARWLLCSALSIQRQQRVALPCRLLERYHQRAPSHLEAPRITRDSRRIVDRSLEDTLSPSCRRNVVFLAAFDVGPHRFASTSFSVPLDSALFFVCCFSGCRRRCAPRILDWLLHFFPFYFF